MDVMDVWSSQEKERGSLEKGNPLAQPHISHRLSFLACRIGARDLGNDTALCSQRSWTGLDSWLWAEQTDWSAGSTNLLGVPEATSATGHYLRLGLYWAFSLTNTFINLMPLFFKGRECKSRATAVAPGPASAAHCHRSSCRMPAGWLLRGKQWACRASLREITWKFSRSPASVL